MPRSIFSVCALLLVATAPVANAQLYLRLEGASQGPIEGDVEFGPLTGTILTSSFSLGITTPVDPVTGLPSGQISVQPLFLSKLTDSATVSMLRALLEGEDLTTCVLDAYWSNGGPGTVLALRLTLAGARLESWSGSASGESSMNEAVGIAFDTLEWHDYLTGDVYTYTMGSSSVLESLEKNVTLLATPNPTSGQTQFAFRLPETGTVSIEIFDTRGRQVATVFEGEASEQQGIASWDGHDAFGHPVANGIYLVKMRAGAWLTTTKMSVLR